VWDNVSFADNYYVNPDVSAPGLSSPGSSLLNADINLNLGGRFALPDASGKTKPTASDPGGTSEDVLDWYAGTVSIGAPTFGRDTIIRRLFDIMAGQSESAPPQLIPWYTAQESAGQMSSPAYASTAASWEGIGEGWFYSVLGGGVAQRPQNTKADQPKVSVSYDNTNFDDPGAMKSAMPTPAVATLFNGDFESGSLDDVRTFLDSTHSLSTVDNSFIPAEGRDLPGWSFQGFSEDDLLSQLNVDSTTGNRYVELEGGMGMTHNWSYIPKGKYRHGNGQRHHDGQTDQDVRIRSLEAAGGPVHPARRGD
jgi:hypothetical protein